MDQPLPPFYLIMILIVGCDAYDKYLLLCMEASSLKVFGQTVRFFRKGQQISQEELADRCGFHRTYIGQLERGERNPALINILKLCEALGISPALFFAHFLHLSGTKV